MQPVATRVARSVVSVSVRVVSATKATEPTTLRRSTCTRRNSYLTQELEKVPEGND